MKGKFFHMILLDAFLSISWGWREIYREVKPEIFIMALLGQGTVVPSSCTKPRMARHARSRLQFLSRKLSGINIWGMNTILNIFLAFWDNNSYTDKIGDAEHKHRLLISISYNSSFFILNICSIYAGMVSLAVHTPMALYFSTWIVHIMICPLKVKLLSYEILNLDPLSVLLRESF